MNRVLAFVGTILVTATLLHAEVEIKPSAAVQVTRNAIDTASDVLDDSFIRGEIKFSGSTDEGTEGMLHLRFQSNFSEGKSFSPTIRQAYFDIPIFFLHIMGGRWHETYTPGEYFGKYLYEVKGIVEKIENPEGISVDSTIGYGNGAMKTNYTVLDGLRFRLDLTQLVNLDIYADVLPQNVQFDKLFTAYRFVLSPTDNIKVGAGVNLNVVDKDKTMGNRYAVIGDYTIMEDLGVYTEVAYTTINADESILWVMGGLGIPTANILDMLRIEVEFTPDRLTTEDELDLGWMIVTEKKFSGIALNFNLGVDPRGLKSRSLFDIGAYLRTTVKF